MSSKSAPITLDHAIAVTAYAMQRHNLPQLLPTLKRLIAARDDLLVNGDALEFAKRVLENVTIETHKSDAELSAPEKRNAPSLQNYNIDTNQTSMHDAS